jgi:hypothetical protein
VRISWDAWPIPSVKWTTIESVVLDDDVVEAELERRRRGDARDRSGSIQVTSK